MFVRYESIFDNVDRIVNFAGLPKSCAGSFPERRSRGSVLADLPPETISQLDYMYGDLANELADLADAEIREIPKRRFSIARYMRSPYPSLLVRQAFDESKAILRKRYPKPYSVLRRISRLGSRPD